MRALSLAETTALIAVGASVLAVVVPTFVRNLHASYVSEATSGVTELASRTAVLLDAAQSTSALPDAVPLTPATVPRGNRAKDPPGTWDHPSWRKLEFGFDSAHAYSFAFDAERTPQLAKFRARAHGDLDGDAILSTIEIEGAYSAGGATTLLPMDVQHEIE